MTMYSTIYLIAFSVNLLFCLSGSRYLYYVLLCCVLCFFIMFILFCSPYLLSGSVKNKIIGTFASMILCNYGDNVIVILQ